MSHEEEHVIAALADLCREQKTQCLIQVGAGDGYEAWRVSAATGCRSIAIEGNTACRSCSPALEYHHIVVGATDGITTFYAHQNAELSGHFPRGDCETAIQVPQQRLDTFCAIRFNLAPDALIVDTEGTTMEVLEGCGALLYGVNVVYAEVQGYESRPGIRTVGQVDGLLARHGLTKHTDPPSYGLVSGQFNMTWVR